MPYNPQTEQSIVLSKYHMKLLDSIGALPLNKRKRRQQLEWMIEREAKRLGILELMG